MTNDEEVLRLLASIDRRLALLTRPQERDLRQMLEKDLLRTDARVRMFDGIDGQRRTPELAKMASVSERSVQLFVKELLDMGLIHEAGAGGGRGVLVERDDDAIVRWYLQQEGE